MSTNPLVSVIIPCYNRLHDLDECILSVKKSTYRPIEIVVADDCSTDGTLQAIQKIHPEITLTKTPINGGAALARNIGANTAQGSLMFFLDSDATVFPDTIEKLVSGFKSKKDAAIIGPIINYHDQSEQIWFAGATIGLYTGKTTYQTKPVQQTELYTTGHIPTAFMVKKEVFEQLDGFDTSYYIIFEESDLAERSIQAGYKVYINPNARATHKLSFASFENADKIAHEILGIRSPGRGYLIARNRIRYMKKNAPFLGKITFFSLFLPALTGYYLFHLLRLKKLDIAKGVLKGTWHGLKNIYGHPNGND